MGWSFFVGDRIDPLGCGAKLVLYAVFVHGASALTKHYLPSTVGKRKVSSCFLAKGLWGSRGKGIKKPCPKAGYQKMGKEVNAQFAKIFLHQAEPTLTQVAWSPWSPSSMAKSTSSPSASSVRATSLREFAWKKTSTLSSVTIKP